MLHAGVGRGARRRTPFCGPGSYSPLLFAGCRKTGGGSCDRCGGDGAPFGREGSETVSRDEYKLVQTPQVFDADLLKQAYGQPYTSHFTDDASVVEALGKSVYLTEGNREILK